MKDLTVVKTMSSLEIASLCGKRHSDVLETIRNVLKEAEIDSTDFVAEYKDKSGKTNVMFNLPRRECDLIVAGYSVKYRLAIIDRWQELEKEVRNGLVSVPTTAEMFVQAGNILVDLERSQNAIAKEVKILSEKVARLEQNKPISSVGGKTYLTPQEIGKMFYPNISAHKVNAILVDLGLQENIGAWVMTDEGRQYGKYIQISESAHCKRLKWEKSIVDVIERNV